MGQHKRLFTPRGNILRDAHNAAHYPPGMDFSVAPYMQRNYHTSDGITPEQSDTYFRAFFDMFGSGRLLNLQTVVKRMEVKIVMAAIMATGLASFILGVVYNMGTWRGNVLFVLGAAFMLIRICVYMAKAWQDYRIKEFELEEKKRARREAE
jgi:hypothetical protein